MTDLDAYRLLRDCALREYTDHSERAEDGDGVAREGAARLSAAIDKINGLIHAINHPNPPPTYSLSIRWQHLDQSAPVGTVVLNAAQFPSEAHRHELLDAMCQGLRATSSLGEYTWTEEA